MGIKISEIMVRNYRSLRDLHFKLNDTAVIIGQNNSGKTSIIQAFLLALTYGPIQKEDVFISEQCEFSVDTEVTIDIKIIPTQCSEPIAFDEQWGRIFGKDISLDEVDDSEFFAFRTLLKYDPTTDNYANGKKVISSWQESGEHLVTATDVSSKIFQYIEPFFVTAQRDISVDLKNRTSVWGKFASRIKLGAEIKKEINEQLGNLNETIIKESPLLLDIKNELPVATADRSSKVDITPIRKDIDSLYRSGMNIYYKEDEGASISVENLGQGVRSWAVLSTIKAQIKQKITLSCDKEIPYHPIILVEEPEAHIHPQAQAALYEDIQGISGQKILTTHSPSIAYRTKLSDFISVTLNKAETTACSLSLDDIEKDDFRKVERAIRDTHGEIFFSRAVILAEGETEFIALPIYFRRYFGKEPFELGVSIIGTSGGANFYPFLATLKALNMKWLIFSDGEPDAFRKVTKSLKKANIISRSEDLTSCDRVVFLDSGLCYEQYLVKEGYYSVIESALCEIQNKENPIKEHILSQNRQNKKINWDTNNPEDKNQALIHLLFDNKTTVSRPIAEKIVTLEDNRCIPPKIRELFEKLPLSIPEV